MAEERPRIKTLVDLVGTAGVVLGLVFVGLELRNNTEAVKAATFQNLTDISNTYIMQIAADPELARIQGAARAGGLRALTPADSTRYEQLQRAFWVRMQNVFSQYARGTLSEDDFFLYRQVICGPERGKRDMWAEHRGILTPTFVEFVESCWDG
jgi:hypothetical protein